MKTKLGLIFAGTYALIALYFILSQGLFGESFIALILGMPWTLLLAAFEFFNAEGIIAAMLLILPMALNAYILYRIGNAVAHRLTR